MTVADSNWKCCTVFYMCVCGNNGKESGSVAYGDTTCKYLQAWSHLASCFWAYIMEVLSNKDVTSHCAWLEERQCGLLWASISIFQVKASDLELGFLLLLLLLFNPHEIIACLLNVLPEILKKTNFGCWRNECEKRGWKMVLCHLHAERSFRQVWCDLILDNSI